MAEDTKEVKAADEGKKPPRRKETVKSVNLRMKDDVRTMLLDLNDHQQRLAYNAQLPLNMTLEFAVRRAHEAVFGGPSAGHASRSPDHGEREKSHGAWSGEKTEPDHDEVLSGIEAQAREAAGKRFGSQDM